MEEVELRLSPDEALYVINLNGDEVKRVLEILADGAKNDFEESVACIGSSICQIGVRDSQELLQQAIQAVRKAGIKDGALPQIHISGCPSSCGTHQIGAIGFHGGVKMIDKVAQAAFTLHLNGCDHQGKERMGEQIGVILQEKIPAFLVELGKVVEASGMDYRDWAKEHGNEVKEIAGTYLV